MVPKACETPNIGCVQKTSTDECCKCLLAKSVRKPSEPSFLTRVLSSFRLTKTTSENDSSTYSMAIENEDFSENCERESSTECRTCDRKHHLDSNCERDCTEGKPTSMTGNILNFSLLIFISRYSINSFLFEINEKFELKFITTTKSLNSRTCYTRFFL